MSVKQCRKCNDEIAVKAKICPSCGYRDWLVYLKGPPALFLIAILGLFVGLGIGLLGSHAPSDSGDDEGGQGQQAQSDYPPTPLDSMDLSQSKMQQKALWVIQTLRSAHRAQTCGLRGAMWLARLEDAVFKSAQRDQQALRTESTAPAQYDSYAKLLEKWVAGHMVFKPPSTYECDSLARSQEIAVLIKTDESLRSGE